MSWGTRDGKRMVSVGETTVELTSSDDMRIYGSGGYASGVPACRRS